MGRSPELVFRIKGMDCAEEVALLGRAVGPLVGGEQNLAFDLLAGKLIVQPPQGRIGLRGAAGLSSEQIVRAVASTGLTAEPWRDDDASRAATLIDETRARHLRSGLVLLSASALAIAFGIHVTLRGWSAALHGTRGGAAWPPAVLALYVLAVASGLWLVAPRAWAAVRRARPDMNLLMTIAVAGAIALGDWFEAASVSCLFALALLLENWSITRARRAVRALVAATPATARVLAGPGAAARQAPVSEVAIGALILVNPGERIPLDGTLAEGTSAVNQAPITGESLPVEKRPGDELFAGTINGAGALTVSVTRAAGDTTLARIIRLVEEARSRRAPSERWVDAFARRYTPLMLALAVALAVAPPLVAGKAWTDSFYNALVVLVIACPCALVIATPVSVVAGLTAAARAGVLIKGGVHLEAPARLRAVAVDKTGTLTHGEPEVADVITLDDGHTPQGLLLRAAALEARSGHPLARAIVARARAHGANGANGANGESASELRELPGLGAEGVIAGNRYWIGSHRLLHERGAETPEMHAAAARLEAAGQTVVALGRDGHVCGLLGLADRVRADAADVVRRLKATGVAQVVMLTGDSEGAASRVAAVTGVDSYAFGLLPAEKARRVQMLAEKYGHVAMVGDGVNDAPALAAATLGIAMGAAGSDAAIETADIALMNDDLRKLPWLIQHSRRVLSTIRWNIAFALAVKAVFLILALLGQTSLWMAIAADMGASLAVILNGLRLLDGRQTA